MNTQRPVPLADTGAARARDYRLASFLLQLAFWGPLLFCTYLALVPDPPDNPVFRLGDVVLHGAAFTYLTFALVLVLLRREAPASGPFPGRVSLISAAAMLGYGLLLELAQSFIPERTAELKDVLVDLAGILMGLVLARVLARWIRDLLHRFVGLLPRSR